MKFFLEHLWGINIGSESCCVIFSALILVAMVLNKRRTKAIRLFALFIVSMDIAIVLDLLSYVVYETKYAMILQTIISCLGYFSITLSVFTFGYYLVRRSDEYYGIVISDKATKWSIAYMIFCNVLYCSSIWSGWIFSIGDDGLYIVGPYSFLSGLVFLPMVVYQFYIIIRDARHAPKRETEMYMSFIVLYATFGFIDSILMTTVHYLAATIFAIVIYIAIELEQEEILEENQKELVISELNALRLQINPHYIYNVLASIDGLILLNPDEARTLVLKFIKHLRGSYLDDVPDQVNIKTELKNLEYYLDVEKIRFPDLKVEYDITVDDFNVPPLIIQPMVENAVKYGICAREDSSGTITIKTYEEDDAYYVVIKDDGVGYDTNTAYNDGRNHIGIANTRKRLKLLCNGRLQINSVVGVGTEVSIIIPKERE